MIKYLMTKEKYKALGEILIDSHNHYKICDELGAMAGVKVKSQNDINDIGIETH